MHRQGIVLGAAIALIAGCSHNHNMNHKAATAQPMAKATCEEAVCETAAAPAPMVATDNLAGAWSLAMPRQNQRQAKIEMIDATHVKIDAAELSGTYAVQGKFLLIITRDEKLRPLAWQINTPDSITVVRSPEIGEGTDYMGVTLVRAAGDATASSDDESQADANGAEQN